MFSNLRLAFDSFNLSQIITLYVLIFQSQTVSIWKQEAIPKSRYITGTISRGCCITIHVNSHGDSGNLKHFVDCYKDGSLLRDNQHAAINPEKTGANNMGLNDFRAFVGYRAHNILVSWPIPYCCAILTDVIKVSFMYMFAFSCVL